MDENVNDVLKRDRIHIQEAARNRRDALYQAIDMHKRHGFQAADRDHANHVVETAKKFETFLNGDPA